MHVRGHWRIPIHIDAISNHDTPVVGNKQKENQFEQQASSRQSHFFTTIQKNFSHLRAIDSLMPTQHNTTLHFTTQHYTTLHYTTLHYTTLHNTTQQKKKQTGESMRISCVVIVAKSARTDCGVVALSDKSSQSYNQSNAQQQQQQKTRISKQDTDTCTCNTQAWTKQNAQFKGQLVRSKDGINSKEKRTYRYLRLASVT